jgi:phosphoribosylaminoimidazole-succinocarboxamide synthase
LGVIVRNHLVAENVTVFPGKLNKYADVIEGRSMLVKKSRPLPIECVVRGYLSGSAWKEYMRSASVCGIKLPEGITESSRLPEPIFTPSTKEEEGHDVNISFHDVEDVVGKELAAMLRDTSLRVYSKAAEMAEQKGIIIADTKFEFGLHDDRLMLIDELLTPDSSRFWSSRDYAPGRNQDSYDKQIVRDYLLTLKWDKTYPGPELPPAIIEKTANRYQEILLIITGRR